MLLFCAPLPASAEGVALHEGLIGYWALDANSGTVAVDSAPFGSVTDNGTLRNNPIWIDGIFGAGLQFNGVNQDVLIPNSNDLDINASAVTLAAWVKLDQLPSQISGSFSGIYDSAPDNYVLYLDKGNNELRFKVTTSNGAAARPGVPASLLNTSNWLHVMGVYGGNGTASIYFNGQLASMEGTPSLVGPVRIDQTAAIGSQVTASSPYSASNLFKGGIADVAVWNRALGLAESQYLYNGGAGRSIGSGNPTIAPIAPQPPNNPPIIVEAHRGNSVAAPENTLAAITAAAGYANWVEMDGAITLDGKLVLMHDSSLDRTTNGTGSVASRNYTGYIDGLDAGSWFSSSFAGEKVPLLSEAVQHTLSLGMTPLIERKSGSAMQYVAELTALGALDQCVMISFDWNFLSQVRALAPNLKLGALGSGTITASVINNVLAAGGNFLDWSDGAAVTQSAVDLVHAAGLELHVWTVNNLARMQQLINLGVDGITTDAPQVLRSIVPWPPIAGDFNGDDVVDGADYVVWRKSNGTTEKYAEWRANFGNSRSNGAGLQSPAVPEPNASIFVLLAFASRIILCGLRRCRASQEPRAALLPTISR